MVETCSILTTTPNKLMATVHDRMPVILQKEHYDLWLDPGMTRVEVACELLAPFDYRLMRYFPVSNHVNSVANDDEACSFPAEVSRPQSHLFYSA